MCQPNERWQDQNPTNVHGSPGSLTHVVLDRCGPVAPGRFTRPPVENVAVAGSNCQRRNRGSSRASTGKRGRRRGFGWGFRAYSDAVPPDSSERTVAIAKTRWWVSGMFLSLSSVATGGRLRGRPAASGPALEVVDDVVFRTDGQASAWFALDGQPMSVRPATRPAAKRPCGSTVTQGSSSIRNR